MTESKLDLAAALTDVRRAYRLIYAYQRRVSDLLQEVSSTLGARGLEFYWWEANLFGGVGRGGTPFFAAGRWAWDMLPGYAPHCDWRSAAGPDQRRVVVVIRADTGFLAKQGEPDPATFAQVEASRSELQIFLCRATGGTLAPDAYNAWDQTWADAWETVKGLGDLRDGRDHVGVIGPAQFTYRYIGIDIAQLPDAAAVRSKLIDPLVEWASVA